MSEMKQWKCRKGHVLGVVQRVKTEWGFISRLMLFRHAIDLESNGTMEEVDVIANVEGTTLDVACDATKCGEKRTWHIGRDAIEKLQAMYVAE